ncbi:MAG: flagellar basal body-associated FliL family protein [Rhodoferax sp.]|nr:flagellar basal body-associated FliL family protein [Rhodoferax sp.]
MATKPDAAKPDAAEEVKAPAKSKKLLIIALAGVLVLALAGGGAWFFFAKQKAATEDGEEAVQVVEQKGPPTFMPLDNMVVNLADPGGERVAQIGITLELMDAKATEKVKMYLPAIRSGILILISQRTAEELLQREGKELLAADILSEASRPFLPEGGNAKPKPKKDADKAKKKTSDKAAADGSPVRGVLFSSFIVQ